MQIHRYCLKQWVLFKFIYEVGMLTVKINFTLNGLILNFLCLLALIYYA